MYAVSASECVYGTCAFDVCISMQAYIYMNFIVYFFIYALLCWVFFHIFRIYI